MTRYIGLPTLECQVSLGKYLIGIRHAMRHPDTEYKHGLTTWWTTTGREIRRQFRDGIHDRINQRTPYLNRGVSLTFLTD